MKHLIITLDLLFTIFLLPYEISAQNKNTSIKQIDAYCKTVDASTKRYKNPQLVFADISLTEKPKWRKFASAATLEKFRYRNEAYTITWQKNGRINHSNFTVSSQSGDWAQYVYHYFRPDGTLAKMESELRTFYGDLIVLQKKYFDQKGKLLSKSIRYKDLRSKKPTKPSKDFMKGNEDFINGVEYKKTSKLPFARLLKKP